MDVLVLVEGRNVAAVDFFCFSVVFFFSFKGVIYAADTEAEAAILLDALVA